RREPVREEKKRAAQKRGRQQRSSDVAPVVPGAAAQAFGRLAPLRTDAIERWQEHEDHERDLEVRVDKGQAAQLVQPHAVGEDVDAAVLKEQRDKTDGSDRGNK